MEIPGRARHTLGTETMFSGQRNDDSQTEFPVTPRGKNKKK